MKKKIFIVAFCLFAYVGFSQDANAIVGVWEPSNGKVYVKISKIDNKYYGKIVWLREPNDTDTGKPKTDKNNPDESMKNVPLKGYRMLKDLVYDGKSEWKDGTIYDPQNGTTYNCVVNLKNKNTIELRGYVGVKTFGRTDTWKRLEKKKK
ncbi:DUF2147 domain-containing protein [uncultured Polaribacter sp.]|uniref:DUF2147 domain-containing protein n=1 Tax=uncultured Polaribacter sp. TaxID=174711 RepID=UPI00261895E6|nr:DUF2147 domain-containing protein [uncultured Polaribacter sp.]